MIKVSGADPRQRQRVCCGVEIRRGRLVVSVDIHFARIYVFSLKQRRRDRRSSARMGEADKVRFYSGYGQLLVRLAGFILGIPWTIPTSAARWLRPMAGTHNYSNTVPENVVPDGGCRRFWTRIFIPAPIPRALSEDIISTTMVAGEGRCTRRR